MMARPSEFTVQIADAICERLADGESLRAICRDEEMPAKSTVFRWLAENQKFQDQYARAREAQADAHADDIIDIADTPQIGKKTKTLPDGKTEVVEGDMIEHRRLRVDARKWVAAKLKPKKYGEKVDLTHQNPDGSNIIPPSFGVSFRNGGPGQAVDVGGSGVAGDREPAAEETPESPT
jgi:hypothetical protein